MSNSNVNLYSKELREKAYNICSNFLGGEWIKISINDMIFKTVRQVIIYFYKF